LPDGRSRGISLRQFSEVFKIRDAHGQPYVLIGGQAVNYWGEHYLSAEPGLEKLRPFTSEDIDFKGGHADVQRIARQLDLTPSYPPKVQMTALAGFISFQIGDLKSAIEVVRAQPRQPASDAQWMSEPGVHSAFQLKNLCRASGGNASKSSNVRKSIVLN
jgi:hypothetical protein